MKCYPNFYYSPTNSDFVNPFNRLKIARTVPKSENFFYVFLQKLFFMIFYRFDVSRCLKLGSYKFIDNQENRLPNDQAD